MHLIVLGSIMAVFGALLLLAAGPGYQADLWDYNTGFAFMRIAAYGGLIAVVLAVVGLMTQHFKPRRAVLFGLAVVIVGGLCAYLPWKWQQRARAAPPIHDITTDTESPPPLIEVLPLREDAPNSAEYGGPAIAEQQRQAYPDIGPLILPMPIDAAFDRALVVAGEMDWEIVSADRTAGRIEATATTPWFGFKDDVVVRLRRAEMGTRVDVRSVSRVGRSDVGSNARRIRTFLDRMEQS